MGTIAENRVDRRQFLRQSGAAAAAVLAGGRLLPAAAAGPTVVIVRDKTKKSIDGFQADADIVQRLVDKAVSTLAGKDDIAKAWATYVSPKSRVAVKFNGLFFRATTHPEVIHAVTNGLIKAGVDPANIVVYDRSDKDMKTARLTINREGKGVRIYGTEGSYGKKVKAGPVGTAISDILAKADVLVNVPMMKSHVRCGVTGALKNHLGTVPNAGAFHRDFCSAVADLNTVAAIKEKTRICITDALYGLYDRGPGYSSRARWDYHGVIASVDPVALDATLGDIIMAKRREKGMQKPHNDPRHIARAAELGLGVADLAKIKRVSVEI
jgi:uncharacterized protein (DUF362 family)